MNAIPHQSPFRDKPALSPAQALVLACARWELSPEQRRQVMAVAKQVADWEAVRALAEAHGVDFFVAHHLSNLAAGWVEPFRQSSQRAAARSVLLLHQQLRLNAEFERAAIPFVWLKGLALSEQLYGRIEARRCLDLDVLTEPHHRPRLEECLSRLGFSRFHDPTPGKDEHFLDAHHHTWSLDVTEGQRLFVEVHHQLGGPAQCQPPAADLLRRARKVMLAGQPVPVPSPEDELLIAGLHAHHHNFGILRALMDVAEYAKRFGRRLDWPKLVALAKGHRCWGRVSAALMLADAALGLDEPPVSLPLSRRQRWAVRGLSAPAVLDTTGEQDDWRRLRLGMLMDRWRDVLRQVGPHFWPPRSYLQALCPRPWGRLPAAARAYHLARLFGKGMHFLLRRVRRLRLSTPVPHRG